MVHAAAAAAARALARAIREYAKRRLIDRYLVEVADNAVAIPNHRPEAGDDGSDEGGLLPEPAVAA